MADMTTPHILTLTLHWNPPGPGRWSKGFTRMEWRAECPYDSFQRPCASHIENWEPRPAPPTGPEPEYRPAHGGWCRRTDSGFTRVADDDPWLRYYETCDSYETWVPSDACWVEDAVAFGSDYFDPDEDIRLAPDVDTLVVGGRMLVDWANVGGSIENARLQLTVLGTAPEPATGSVLRAVS